MVLRASKVAGNRALVTPAPLTTNYPRLHEGMSMAVSQSTTDFLVEYRDIPDWPGYRVGSDGTVWTCRVRAIGHGNNTVVDPAKWRRTVGHLNADGYRVMTFRKTGSRKKYRVFFHVLVTKAFIGEIPPLCQVNHKDGNKDNNRVENLEIVTQAQNAAHASMSGLSARGERQGAAILTRDLVLRIVAAYKFRACGSSEIAARFSTPDRRITRGQVLAVVTGKTWGWLTGIPRGFRHQRKYKYETERRIRRAH